LTRRYRVESLAGHDRSRFSCGDDALDVYFRTRVSQDVRRDMASAFVAVDPATAEVAGFYTLSAATLRIDLLPERLARRLPRYPEAPAVLIGRLAVDVAHQGERLGNLLLVDAIDRALRSEFGVFAIVVDPKNDQARSFYERRQFVSLGGDSRMYLTAATARTALSR
jgi:predicted N-acetyltransferase YhbS